MTNIITVTDKASAQLKKICDNAPKDSVGIIIGIETSGCNGYSYKLDFAKKNEVKNFEFIQKNSIKVFIDPKATMFLIGSEMDYAKDNLSSKFIFKNPNEKSSCGCGESFSI